MMKDWFHVLLFVGSACFIIWISDMPPDVPSPSHSAPSATSVNILNFGAKGDARSDDAKAFEAAIEDATERGVPLVIPRRTYVVNSPLKITSGLLIKSDGATLKHTRDDVAILSAVSVDDWTIEGPLTLAGTRTQAGQHAAENGLLIRNSNRYIVDKLTVLNFKGHGIEIAAGDSTDGFRGDQGQFAFVSFRNNRVGLRIHNGVSAEYNLLTLLSFSGNETAAEIGAGNTVVSTSNIVDNGNGILLTGGVNAGHGIFSSTNINHNEGVNVGAIDIDHGYTFSGCHIYGDSPSKGIVSLKHSRGLHFTGGTFSAAIRQDGGGINAAVDNFMPGTHVGVTGSSAESFIRAIHFDTDQYVSGLCEQSNAKSIQSQCAR